MSFSNMHNNYLDPDRHLWDQEEDNAPDIIYPDADDCYILSIDNNEVRIGVAKDTNNLWFVEVTIDTEHFCNSSYQGPFESYEDAGFECLRIAKEWFNDNEFTPEELQTLEPDIDAITDAIHLDGEIVKAESE